MSLPPDNVMIRVNGLTKQFRVPHNQQTTLKGRILHPLQRPELETFDALQTTSFEVKRGEFFGIVGRNGSGKSTLLKMLAGIYQPSTGSIEVNGSIASFIELGVGFNPELSGRDNLYLNGALLGFSRKELKRRYNAIVAFAELENFMDLKLRNYSSGMQVRLGFSIAVELGADILLIDEVLAVGDERFQRKCYDIFRERKRSGTTVIFVSHDMGAVQQFCDRALLLEQGEPMILDEPRAVAREYTRINSGGQYALDSGDAEQAPSAPDAVEAESGPSIATPKTDGSTGLIGQHVTVERVWVEAIDGAERSVMQQNELIRIRAQIAASKPVVGPAVGISIANHNGIVIYKANTAWLGGVANDWEAGSRCIVDFEFQNFLGNDMFGVSVAVSDDDGTILLDARDILEIEVDSHPNEGAVNIPYRASISSVDETAVPAVESSNSVNNAS